MRWATLKEEQQELLVKIILSFTSAILVASLVGWVNNLIIVLYMTEASPLGEVIVRGIGVVFPSVGAVVGYF